jgi:hypothetical protein
MFLTIINTDNFTQFFIAFAPGDAEVRCFGCSHLILLVAKTMTWHGAAIFNWNIRNHEILSGKEWLPLAVGSVPAKVFGWKREKCEWFLCQNTASPRFRLSLWWHPRTCGSWQNLVGSLGHVGAFKILRAIGTGVWTHSWHSSTHSYGSDNMKPEDSSHAEIQTAFWWSSSSAFAHGALCVTHWDPVIPTSARTGSPGPGRFPYTFRDGTTHSPNRQWLMHHLFG